MPNWVVTRVYVNGDNKKKFLDWVKKHEDSLLNSTTPMPKTYKDWDTTNYKDGKGLKVGDKLTDMQDMLKEIDVTEDFLKGLRSAMKYQKRKYGIVGWYDWRCNNWGTKWEVGNVDIYEDSIEFQTAWGVAEPVVRRWSEMFPNTEFDVRYADEDIGHNCGTFTYSNGKLTNYVEGTAEFARELWGIEEEEE